MIDAMNAGMSMPPPPRAGSAKALTADQQTLISETLSQYDVDNLNEADALSITEAFSEAGIQPGLALEKAVSGSGFDAKSIGDLAKVSDSGNRPPPPSSMPKQSTDGITSMVDYLTELMEEKFTASNSNKLSDADKESILAQVFDEFDIKEGQSVINTHA
ncbi:hypothetical protein [Colwellia psychrerythraea]|uniref:Uncharacterized protein n=1 Tax=Colwellia psychrerythraea TaxID=28229 RepID=A0A099K867_COLPS|nr:hypothetical protein [Colwellia psychrerythraea]KGJ86485.1 hypothetical protein GAB14E_0758 [Colwellia psychrerythraea]